MPASIDSYTYTEEVVTRHEEVSPGVFLIGVKRRHEFHPGQSVKLGLHPDDPPRIYSICSGVDDEHLCVLFSVKPGGLLTPELAKLKVGDRIWISEPYGTFLVGDEPAWMIATGTGIAPFYSHLCMGNMTNKTLVHGVRHRNQFYFETDFSPVLQDRYHRCCSREKHTGITEGRVTEFLKTYPELPSNCSYYVCGQARMAVDVRDLLLSRGIPNHRIMTEIYF
ncbi:MAG: oxidoreductase [Kiritimatiellaceae bacterium]|nr:oxidoreductase [Kiritimatiellaceae bacterium]